MPKQTAAHIAAAAEARQIVKMAVAPFIPAQLAAAISKINPKVGAMIEAAAAQECVALKDGTGRVALAALLDA